MHVRKGDTVLVISGNDKGKTGVVKEAMPRECKVVIEGVNLRWKHRKKKSEQSAQGERIQHEMPIHASNVERVETQAAGKKKRAAQKKAATRSRKKAAADES